MEVNLTKADVSNIINLLEIGQQKAIFRWTKADSKLMLKLNILLKDLNKQSYNKQKENKNGKTS